MSSKAILTIDRTYADGKAKCLTAVDGHAFATLRRDGLSWCATVYDQGGNVSYRCTLWAFTWRGIRAKTERHLIPLAEVRAKIGYRGAMP